MHDSDSETRTNQTTAADELVRIRREYQRRDARGRTGALADPVARIAYLSELRRNIVSSLDELQERLEGARVLDVGCGSGEILSLLVELGAGSGCGIDLMEDRVKAGRQLHRDLRLVHGNAADMPFDDGEFDIVTQFTCLSSVLDPALRAAIAGEMCRVTRPGGAILSYDLRPSPPLLRAGGRCLTFVARRSRRFAVRAGIESQPTPIEPLGLAELRRIFPDGRLMTQSVTLNVALRGLAAGYPSLTGALERVPLLRTHTLAAMRKA